MDKKLKKIQTPNGLKRSIFFISAFLLFFTLPRLAYAQSEASGGLFGLFLAVSALPFLLLALTCFAKIFIVFLLLRSGLATPGIPPGSLLAALALALTVFVMAPVFQKIALLPETTAALNHLTNAELAPALEDAQVALEPLQNFLTRHTRESDRQLFSELAIRFEAPKEGLLASIPAFILSELREAFRVGVLILLPFLAIDLALGIILYGLGITQIDPKTLALPIKLALLLATDGLLLLSKALLLSYEAGGP